VKRLLAGPLVLVFGLMVLPVVGAEVSPSARRVIEFAPVVGWATALAFLVLAVVNLGPARPAGLFVCPGAPSFVVPASRAYAIMTVPLVALAANAVRLVVDLWSRPDFTGSLAFAVFNTACTAALILFQARWIVGVFRGTPMLELTPRGLVVRSPAWTRTFPWDALGPEPLVGGYEIVKLVVVRPELVRWGGPKWLTRRIAMRYAFVHPWFFIDAVRLYVLHPQRRAAIGTPEEYIRLLVDLGVLVPID
jgi:hypothetical protein